MVLQVGEMTHAYAIEIVNWRYQAPYDMYNLEESEADIQELMAANYQAILDQDGYLFGFYCTGEAAQVPKGHAFQVYEAVCLDIGLGMRPDLTGKGFGKVFLAFILQQFEATALRLTVATFNQRAIRLYEGFSFKRDAIFMNGEIEFTTMLRGESQV